MEVIHPSNPEYDYVEELQLTFANQEDDDFYRVFGSSSPFSSLSPSPSPSPRSTSPTMEVDNEPMAGPSPMASSSRLVAPAKASSRNRPLSNQEQKKKAQSKARKRNKKAAEKIERRNEAAGLISNNVRASTYRKHILTAEQLDIAFAKIPIVTTGYIAPRDTSSQTTYRLDQLVGPTSRFNFELVRWTGRKAIPLADTKKPGRIMALLGGMPDDPKWPEIHQGAAKAIEDARPRLKLVKADVKHRRGKFPAMAFGISHGGGQPTPRILTQEPDNYAIFDELVENPDLNRISGFANGVFKAWQPRLYEYYDDHLSTLIKSDPDNLRRTWPNSVFAATSINFGPRTVCHPHTDPSNLPFGWCCITALGNYNPMRGGHVILWKERLVIEFPPGSTIFLNSAASRHSNAAIGKDETRYSITQYTAGGLFRWVDFGFKKAKDYLQELKNDDEAKWEAKLEELANQLTFGLSLISTVDELKGKIAIPTSTMLHTSSSS